MPRNVAVFFFCLCFLGWAGARELPKNPDQGDIVLAGLVITPGEGLANSGLPAGWIPISQALVVIEGTKHATSTDSRGLFIFTEAPEGEVTLLISKDGFESVRRRAVVDSSQMGEPTTLRLEMLRTGSSVINTTLSGSGTLYATFAPRTETATGDDGDFTNLLAVLATDPDPLEIAFVRPPTGRFDPASEMLPVNDLSCSVMIRPSEAPSRTTYHQLGSVPVWPCFDKSGRYLYVSTVYQHRIEIYDVTQGNEFVANVPLENAFVSSLVASPDGRYVYGTQMGRRMGVLAIETATHRPAAFFELSERTMIPNAVVPSPDGSRLYVTLTNAVNPGAPGQLVVLDPVSGAVNGTVTVGSTPTDVLITPDGSTALTVNQGSGTVSVIDLKTESVVRTLSAEVSPTKGALSADARSVLVANKGSGTVSVLSLADGRILHRIKVGKGPMDIVVGADGKEAFVSNYQDGTISVIDVAQGRVKETTAAASRSNPLGLAIRP